MQARSAHDGRRRDVGLADVWLVATSGLSTSRTRRRAGPLGTRAPCCAPPMAEWLDSQSVPTRRRCGRSLARMRSPWRVGDARHVLRTARRRLDVTHAVRSTSATLRAVGLVGRATGWAVGEGGTSCAPQTAASRGRSIRRLGNPDGGSLHGFDNRLGCREAAPSAHDERPDLVLQPTPTSANLGAVHLLTT
jgi:hypothetical protein